MHEIHIPEDILAKPRARRGRVEVFDALDPARTALVVIDMQSYFLKPGGFLEVPCSRDIVGNINRIAATLRRTGGTVYWTQHSFVPEWTSWYGVLASGEFAERMIAASAPDAPGYAIHPDMDVQPQDEPLHKTRYSAMLPESCDLETHLRRTGVDTVIVTGTLTNVCCESTARDAMMKNYKVVFVSDANATRTDEEHNATLKAMVQVFADVRNTNEVVGLLQAGAAGAQAAE
jgi:ureidoacrylate peracid hydrolase